MIILNLRELLFRNNLNQSQLANKTGISASAVNRYYNNSFININKNDIERMCKSLNCNVEDLIKIVPNKESE